MQGKDKEKYEKIYQRKGIMTKKGGYVGEYGSNPILDEKWDRYGHAFEGSQRIGDVLSLKPKSMVDIGCGYNEFVKAVRKSIPAANCVGVDIACPGADIIAPAHYLPFEDKEYDMLVSFDCMEHIPEEEVEQAILEFKRVAERIYLQISLTHSPTRIDGEKVHVCVKPTDWWLGKIRTQFPNAIVRHHERKGTPWEHIIVYGTT